jgi:1-acyl-sn-glycerol-3-phosphate acyltransferase
MQSWGKSIIFVCGIKVHKNKKPGAGNFIIMPNHRSYTDIFLVAAYSPAGFVAKAELMNWPLLKTGARLTNSIFVSRTDIKSLISTMHKIKSSVDKQIPVAIFPEGTTSKGPLTRPFKNGSFKIAADAKIPVIPMAIHYKDIKDSWIDNDTFVVHFLKQMSKPVTKVFICYGTPHYNSDYKILQKTTREQIDQMLTRMIKKVQP